MIKSKTKRKGIIQKGADADIAILDPEAEKTISAKTHHQNLDYNVFEGMKVKGVVKTTISRGKIVWDNNQLYVEKGTGKFEIILFFFLSKENVIYSNIQKQKDLFQWLHIQKRFTTTLNQRMITMNQKA